MEKRKNDKGVVTFREQIYIDGKCIKSPSFVRVTDAKQWKANKLKERSEYQATGLSFNPTISLKEFCDTWFHDKVEVRQSVNTQRNYRSDLNNYIIPLLGYTPIGKIDYKCGNKLVTTMRRKGKSHRTCNKVLMELKTILNDAVRWNYIPKSPLFGFPELHEDLKIFKYWTETEIMQFLRANLNTREYPLYVTALNTGMRLGEVLGLCWDRVNLVQEQIEVTRIASRGGSLKETTKTHKKRIVPINDVLKRVFATLRARVRANAVYVFTDEDGRPYNTDHFTQYYFKNAQIRAGFEQRIRFHDLRHTFASHFVMNGGSIYDLQKILGHSEISMTERYAHQTKDYLRTASNIVNFCIKEEETEQKDERSLYVVG